MKRILSIALALCMIIAMLPAAAIAGAEDTAYVYDFNPKDVSDTSFNIHSEYTAYDKTDGTWRYHAASGSFQTKAYYYKVNAPSGTTLPEADYEYGIQIRSTAVGDWAAFEIKPPAAGNYSVSVRYGCHNKNGGKGNVYIIPGSTADIGAALTAALNNEPISYYDSTNKSYGGKVYDCENNVTIESTEESYYVVFSVSGTDGSLYQMFPQNITLTPKAESGDDGGEEPVVTYSGYKAVYDFRDTADDGRSTTYETTGSFWKFGATSAGWETVDTTLRKRSYGIQLQSLSDGKWAALVINVPVAGTYKLILDHTTASQGAVGQNYIIPANADIDEGLLNADYKLKKTVDFYSADTAATSTELGDYTFENAGEYYFVFTRAGNSPNYTGTGNRTTQYPTTLILDGGEKTAPMALSGELTASVTVDAYSELTVTATMSDKSKSQLAPSQLSFKSLDEAVATVDANGYVTGVSEGKTTVEFETKDGTANGSCEVEVGPRGEVQTLFVYDFNEGLAVGNKVNTISEYGTTRGLWKYENAKGASVASSSVHKWGVELRTAALGEWVAFRIKVTSPGRYFATLTHGQSATLGGYGDVYILPGNTSDIDTALESAAPLGTNIAYFGAANTEIVVDKLSGIDLAAGEHILVFKASAKGASNFRQYPGILELDAANIFRFLDLSLEKTEYNIYADGTADKGDAAVTAKLLDGSVIPENELEIVYGSEDIDVASFADGVVTALGYGTTNVYVTVTHQGISVTAKKQITVTDTSGIKEAKISADSAVFVDEEVKLKTSVLFNSGKELGISDVTYEITDGSGEILDGGYVTSAEAGDVKLVGRFMLDGEEMETSPLTITFRAPTLKTESTYYTEERVRAARANIKKYDWAKSALDTATGYADTYLETYDELYELMTSEGLPRSNRVGAEGDPDYSVCRYCGVDINVKYGSRGSNAYDVDVINRPWKVQCPDCKRLFPSNDFDKFYELGLNQQGEFDRLRALRAHRAMLIEKGLMTDNGEEEPTDAYDVGYHSDEWYAYYGYGVKGGYLYNKLYEELWKDSTAKSYNKDPRTGDAVNGLAWGVDDGLGYLPGRACAKDSSGNDIYERHAYIAYYVHELWKTVNAHITRLAEAYVYTDDAKYGRAGAVLLDRVADLYPGFSYKQWDNMYLVAHGGSGYGKIFGRINDCTYATNWSQAADAFWNIYDDPQVTAFLSEKAEKFGYTNSKTSREKIWANIEEGLLLEIFETTKEGNIYGNYGQQQQALAAAALVLASEPKSKEIMDWIYQPGKWSQNNTTKTAVCTGGNLSVQLVDVVDRDGIGDEAAPNYNTSWVEYLIGCADMLKMYSEDEKYNLYLNPKYAKMFTAHIPLVLTETHTAQIGDSGQTASINFMDDDKMLIEGFQNLKDTAVGKTLAEYIYRRNGYSTDGLYYDIWTADPENIRGDIEARLDGEIEVPSKMLTGYGFAVLRDGAQYGDKSVPTYVNNMRDFWIYFGRNGGHGNLDTLNLGIEAFGLNFAPDLGYPEVATTEPHRYQWMESTISHNTVTVNEKVQSDSGLGSKPLHFDDAGEVKVMDVDAPQVYADTSIYRRTVVMINAGDDVSYGVDFFRVKGGDDHIYSFHSQSDEIAETAGLENIVKQTDEAGNYIGTYAGTTYVDPKTGETKPLEYGADPCGSYDPDLYYVQRGFTWLKNIRRAADVDDFVVDFKVTDFRKAIKDGSGLHLRMTMLNDFELSEVALASGSIPEKSENAPLPETFEYVLARRKGENLDSLFTTVYEPYRNTRYISDMSAAAISVAEGTPKADDAAKAVKVTRTDGRVDYVIYATNNSVLYTVTDGDISFNFRGFVGVYSVVENENGGYDCVYSYVHDGDVIGEKTGLRKAYTGKISDFTRELEFESSITVNTDDVMDETALAALAGKYMFVTNDGVQNGVYEIAKAESTNGGVKLYLADSVSPIRSYKDANDTSKGFAYNVSIGQTVTVPVSNVEDASPAFDAVSDSLSTSAGSSITVNLNATSELDSSIEYIGTTLPRGASINAETGALTWRPDASQVGENHAAVTARDAEGRESTVHFTITVYGSTTGSTGSTNTPSVGEGGGGGGGSSGQGSTNGSDTGTDTGDQTPAGDANETPSVGDASSSLGEGASGEHFTDLGNHAWAADAINTLADNGIIKGTTANTYSPANNITRADYALLLVRAFNLTSGDTTNFDDVLSSDYFAAELAIARNTGIVNGIGDNKYAPRSTITRQDMMVITYRALDALGLIDTTNPVGRMSAPAEYPDYADVADYARDAVDYLIANGLVNGKNGLIAPTDYTTRAEVAVLLKRILDYVK